LRAENKVDHTEQRFLTENTQILSMKPARLSIRAGGLYALF